MKEVLKKGLKGVKKAANSNKYTRKLARRAKQSALAILATHDNREIYNLSTYYPTINEYYSQLHDTDVKNGPLISILLPTYNTPEIYLRECIESIIVQSYSNWELCIADDNSSDKNVVKIIKQYQKTEPRIKLIERSKNGHISLATNSALELAKGEFVALMDHDDVLWPNALYEMAKAIKQNKNVDFIYSDEDKIDGKGKIHSYPFLKPDFSPEFLESCNYITHFSCIRKTIMDDIGGFRKGYEGAQDWDLFIRISEKTQNIIHIPKLLYSWRIHEASTASDTDAKPYVYEAQKKLLVDHLTRQNKAGVVETGVIKQHRTIKYAIDAHPKVSVVIFYSSSDSFGRLASSMRAHTAGIDCEIVVAIESDTELGTEGIKEHLPDATIYNLSASSGPRNYKQIAKKLSSDYLIFVDDEIEFTTDEWAKIFVADNQIIGVGFVGALLLEEDKATVKSAGVGIGYGPTGYTDMLQGMPFDDPHYSRGLYAKSRRNVSAVNNGLFCVSKQALQKAEGKSVVDLCVSILGDYRHIYTPYVRAVLHNTSYEEPPELAKDDNLKDKYLNPNFDHSNQRMEVRA